MLVDAKSEYTQQLVSTLTPHLYEGILSIFQDCDRLVDEETNQLKALMFGIVVVLAFLIMPNAKAADPIVTDSTSVGTTPGN